MTLGTLSIHHLDPAQGYQKHADKEHHVPHDCQTTDCGVDKLCLDKKPEKTCIERKTGLLLTGFTQWQTVQPLSCGLVDMILNSSAQCLSLNKHRLHNSGYCAQPSILQLLSIKYPHPQPCYNPANPDVKAHIILKSRLPI